MPNNYSILEFRSTKQFKNESGILNKSWDSYVETCVFWDSRLFKKPAIIENIESEWNGKTIDVQASKWDSFQLVGIVKESEMTLINEIKLCDYAQVINPLGDNTVFDLSNRNYIDIVSEEIDDTKNFKVTINFRANKIIIDYQKVNEGLVTLNVFNSVDIDTNFTNFSLYTNLLPIFSITDFEQINEKIVATNVINRITNNRSFLVRIYLSESDTLKLNDYLIKCDSVTVVYNFVSYFIYDKKIEFKQVGIDCYELNLELSYENKVFYPFE
jgi:hypothetical protein